MKHDNPMQCECADWARDDVLAGGHHENCALSMGFKVPKDQARIQELEAEVESLKKEQWASLQAGVERTKLFEAIEEKLANEVARLRGALANAVEVLEFPEPQGDGARAAQAFDLRRAAERARAALQTPE